MARTLPRRGGRRAGRSGGGALGRVAALLSRLNDPADTTAHIVVAALLLVAEAVLCLLIIRNVPYTEIDWVAYMQEVTGYLEGERDYTKMKGDTGPLVYPAGFVYLFAALKHVTGGSVQAAQYIFAGLYLATQAVVLALYIRAASLPPWSLALLAASRRLHSIYVLRLFNDCWAMLVAYVATLALQSRQWMLSVVLYSLAVSVKMNVLLMAPGVLAVLLKHARLPSVAAGVVLGVTLQLALGAPFLATFPKSYLTRAFEFSRVFTFKWSVNWQMLPEPAFLSRQLALALMFIHLRLLWALANKKWLSAEGGVLPALTCFLTPPSTPPASSKPGVKGTGEGAASAGHGFQDSVLFLVFSSNVVGIVCSRTIHYQFYSWYYHTLPFLLLRSPLPKWLAVGVLAGIELVYNIYPPRAWASTLLLALHLVLLGATLTISGQWALSSGGGGASRGSGAANTNGGAAAGAAAGADAAETMHRRRSKTA